MPKFKIKGFVIEELPELEIEAEDREKAEGIYEDKYYDDEIEGDLEVQFEKEDEEYDGTPRIIEINGKNYPQDILGISESPLEESKIYNIKDENLPDKIWDNIEYSIYYQQRGYRIIEGGNTKTDNAMNMLYQKIKKAEFCIDCKIELTDFDLEKVKRESRCLKCQSVIWAEERKELKDKAEKIALEISKISEFIKLPNIPTKRIWIENKYPELKSRSRMIVDKANNLIYLAKSQL
ncbi:hypothetical protein HYT25_04105 [Candidatus Pacearchaeota archaeon]|nr:hypothetical protein [Candidatus Pacearchaeota archaeon]